MIGIPVTGRCICLARLPRPPSVMPTLLDAAASTRVPTLPPDPATACLAPLPSLLSAKPPAQAPRRLQSAGSSGVDSPIIDAARYLHSGPRSGCFLTPNASEDACMPCARLSYTISRFRRHPASGACRIERMSIAIRANSRNSRAFGAPHVDCHPAQYREFPACMLIAIRRRMRGNPRNDRFRVMVSGDG